MAYQSRRIAEQEGLPSYLRFASGRINIRGLNVSINDDQPLTFGFNAATLTDLSVSGTISRLKADVIDGKLMPNKRRRNRSLYSQASSLLSYRDAGLTLLPELSYRLARKMDSSPSSSLTFVSFRFSLEAFLLFSSANLIPWLLAEQRKLMDGSCSPETPV